MDKVKTSSKPVVLIAPLDWGLGHATRCIPIIREFLDQGFTVILAAEGLIRDLYRAEFPGIECIHLTGYRIKYSRYSRLLPFKLILRIPGILATIRYENKWLQQIVSEKKIDVVVSDNRYGLYTKKATCIFITHQLKIRSGFGYSIDRILKKLNYNFIHQFDQCWVPDYKKLPALAGSLSHPLFEPKNPLHYLGPLSRFKFSGYQGHQHILFLLSGPEPQRTYFENLLIQQSKFYNGKIILVRGIKPGSPMPEVPEHVKVYTLLSAAELSIIIDQASFVIARCGYSTVMDMIIKNKQCILVPTPGQTEQIYLAAHLMKNHLALCIDQSKFKLVQALDLASGFTYKPMEETEVTKLSYLIHELKRAI